MSKEIRQVDETNQELNRHGSKELPLETYENNCEIFKAVYNHWHKEMEMIYVIFTKLLFKHLS